MSEQNAESASQQNAENATQTTQETTDTNAGPDAVQGTVAEQEPTDIGDQKPMDDFGTDSGGESQPAPEERQSEESSKE